MTELLKVGKIVNTHGVRGEIRVISTTDFAEERYAKGTELWIEHPDTKKNTPVVVASHRVHKNFDLLTFEGYHSINEVEPFKGSTLLVTKDQLSELEENEFYYHEIIGCTVYTDQDEELGKVKEIIETGANDVWVIRRSSGGKDILIPYIKDVVKEIDIEARTIYIQLMEGLVE
ncbi:ribosome maturation factor RimM [Alkalihalophilus lindianensis]|uniref:Ribosome maturation factor RimM n=1 Tax=Alkalihalophilus lindianensis TaxID=1630542 RepID=A0ABU3XBY9_9BACI|nr:ribosome maturation factor RimM [Alkalihalophilus lindianensis]MDV2685405.1 ribosome maturation factor RimM [Alkalihalophilus lindianensis]